ncbi:hypothetical protein [Ottowia thiooxydans]|uniref:hypothetical protein n=1 Tax=Ottowia thiooxydans TaxID=219182 RepID=UPI0003FCBEC4|nr:hypothetical protein [Ottowia thiooxydans]
MTAQPSHASQHFFDANTLPAHWQRLHVLDCEPLPQDPLLLQGWALLHAGDFEKAELTGLSAGLPGISLANRAASAYATLIESREKARLDLFQRIQARSRAHAAEEPDNPNAWFWQGYALTRYSQGIHVARALAQGLGAQILTALNKTLELAPDHVYAHLTLGSFHAEVIEKVGALIGAMTYGARAETSLAHFREAQRLAPDSAAVMVNYADALVSLEGEARLAEATRLYEQAAGMTPRDAVERLWVELARTGLAL